jgi:hypothetical protein
VTASSHHTTVEDRDYVPPFGAGVAAERAHDQDPLTWGCGRYPEYRVEPPEIARRPSWSELDANTAPSLVGATMRLSWAS